MLRSSNTLCRYRSVSSDVFMKGTNRMLRVEQRFNPVTLRL